MNHPNNPIYPLKLVPVYKQILWGGTRLKTEYGKQCEEEKLAESWELTVRSDGINTIANGVCAGMGLNTYLGDVGCPLLIKWIDAKDDLSIQVHPNDAYALEKEGEYGKTEVWYIAEADENAEIVYGLAADYSKEAFQQALEQQAVESLLQRVRVKKGEVYFIPAGLVHAIGKGILIAEIQQNSNITYRVYDYNRRQKDGSLRELHIKKALDSIYPFTEEEIQQFRFEKKNFIQDPTLLVSCRYFTVNRYWISTSLALVADTFHSVLCIDGKGAIVWDGGSYPISKGESYYIPAGLGAYTIVSENITILVSQP